MTNRKEDSVSPVKVRLLEFISENVKNVSTFEKSLKFSNGFVNNIKKSIGTEKLEQILRVYPQLNRDWLLYGEGDMLSPIDNISYDKSRLNKKNSSIRKNVVPFYDTEATGSNIGTEMTPISAPAGTIDIGDLLHDSSSALRIYGNSMLPNYPPGCVVGLIKKSTGFIQPGEVYVIETRNERLLKRLFYKDDLTNSDTLICVSDNTHIFDGGARHGKLAYPPFEVSREEIIKLFIVTGVIKRNANSVIIDRN